MDQTEPAAKANLGSLAGYQVLTGMGESQEYSRVDMATKP